MKNMEETRLEASMAEEEIRKIRAAIAAIAAAKPPPRGEAAAKPRRRGEAAANSVHGEAVEAKTAYIKKRRS